MRQLGEMVSDLEDSEDDYVESLDKHLKDEVSVSSIFSS